jgi:integrase
MSNRTDLTPDDLMTIDEVVSQWPRYFTVNELNEAMRSNRISYVRKGRGRLLTRAGISAYLSDQTVNPRLGKMWPAAPKSRTTGSGVKEGFGIVAPPHGVGVPEKSLISSILQYYWETHSDATPSAFQARRAGTLLLEWLTDIRKKPEADASDFTLPWQQDFVKWLGQEKNHAVATIAREMTSIAAAFNHALKRSVVVGEDGGTREVRLLKSAVPVLYRVQEISRITAKPEPTPRDWLPTWAQMALFIDTIGTKTAAGAWDKNSENLFRYVICALNTWARPAAVLSLHVPTQVDFEAGSIRLNPPGRKQTKKVRPTIPLTANLAAWLQHWNCERPVHRNGTALKSVKKVFKAHALKLGMPRFTPYTLRHFMATNIRRIDGCHVTREQRQEWLGHKPQDTTSWYEHFDLEWLREARLGTDRIMVKLDQLLRTRKLRPPVSPRSRKPASAPRAHQRVRAKQDAVSGKTGRRPGVRGPSTGPLPDTGKARRKSGSRQSP